MSVQIANRSMHVDMRVMLNAINKQLRTRTISNAGLSASTADVAWSNAVDFHIDGPQIYTKAAGTGDISAVADVPAVQATGTERYYLFTLDASGTFNVVAGEAAASDAEWPEAPDDVAVFGGVKVVNVSGSDFTMGTTAFADVTASFYNLASSPAEGLISAAVEVDDE